MERCNSYLFDQAKIAKQKVSCKYLHLTICEINLRFYNLFLFLDCKSHQFDSNQG